MAAFADLGGAMGMGCLGGLHAMGAMGSGGGNVGFACKMLVTAREAASVSLGVAEIEASTGASLTISNANELYPGTDLQEVTMKAASTDVVSAACKAVMTKMVDEQGRIMNNSRDMQAGFASVRFVVPNAAAKSIIGRGGANISAVRDQLGLKIHVEQTSIGQQPLEEQVVSVYGSLTNVPQVLPNIFAKVEAECCLQSWWGTWIMSSNAGTDGGLMGMPLLSKTSKGKGKDKGMDMGYGKGGGWDMMDMGMGMGGMGMGKGGKGSDFSSASAMAPPKNQLVFDQATMEMIASGLDALPPSIASSREWTQQIEFTIPEASASTLIGRGGLVIREISQSTKTKVQINKIEGNPLESVVVILGTTVGVVSAYLRCLSKLWELGPPGAAGNMGLPGMGMNGMSGGGGAGGGADPFGVLGQFSDPRLAAAAAMFS
eukprot:TRINITY_DN5628_c0_g2_i1.p1 TRINITY_DN5628_c0_g2~~TRINITY_DN5628_c0_g2_i1.p1  ORF type:complete len:478 (+),score=136.90 TRINITY_DN5628_c0_g2_i1:142-1434(+)